LAQGGIRMERHRTAVVSTVAAAAAQPLAKAIHGVVYVVYIVHELLRVGPGSSRLLRQSEERGQCPVARYHPLRISIAPLRPQ
jgi:hypothetical protein